MSLSLALLFTLGPSVEGGFTIDDGGPTNFGVTQATYDAYRKRNNLPLQSVRGIAMYEVHDIYLTMYWTPAGCVYLPQKVGIVHFDWSVNHGVSGAIKSIQTVLNVVSDGEIGPVTKSAMMRVSDGAILTPYLDLRRAWYKQDAANNPGQAQYLNGWLKRVDRLQTYLDNLQNG